MGRRCHVDGGERREPRARGGTRWARLAGLALGLGIEFALLACLGAFAGRYADRRLGTEPYLLLVGLLLGSAAAFLLLVRVVSRLDRVAGPSSSDRDPGE